MAVYKSYGMSAIVHRSEAWWWKENEMRILQRTKRSMETVICGIQLKVRKKVKDLMLMLGLNERIGDNLATVNSVCCNCDVLTR